MSDYEEYETTNQSVDLSSFDDDFATAEAPEYDEVPRRQVSGSHRVSET